MAARVRIRAVVDSAGKKGASMSVDDEFVHIVNEGETPVNMAGWILLKQKPDHKHYNHYYFPAVVEDRELELRPGQDILVITGRGTDAFLPADRDNRSQWILYQNLDQFLWSVPGEKVVLYARVKDEEKEGFIKVDTKEIKI